VNDMNEKLIKASELIKSVVEDDETSKVVREELIAITLTLKDIMNQFHKEHITYKD
jgi:hypothetical protein